MYCRRCGTWVPDDAPACAGCGAAAVAPTASTPPPAPAAATGAISTPPVAHAHGTGRAAYGGFWRRLGAVIVDSIVLYFPASIARALLGIDMTPGGDPTRGQFLLGVTVGTTIAWLYCAALESSPLQGTLGQQLMDLRVTNLRGGRIGFVRASVRYFAQVFSALPLGLGYLAVLWTGRRQTFHDLIAGCVLPRRSEVPLAQPGEVAS